MKFVLEKEKTKWLKLCIKFGVRKSEIQFSRFELVRAPGWCGDKLCWFNRLHQEQPPFHTPFTCCCEKNKTEDVFWATFFLINLFLLLIYQKSKITDVESQGMASKSVFWDDNYTMTLCKQTFIAILGGDWWFLSLIFGQIKIIPHQRACFICCTLFMHNCLCISKKIFRFFVSSTKDDTYQNQIRQIFLKTNS